MSKKAKQVSNVVETKDTIDLEEVDLADVVTIDDATEAQEKSIAAGEMGDELADEDVIITND